MGLTATELRHVQERAWQDYVHKESQRLKAIYRTKEHIDDYLAKWGPVWLCFGEIHEIAGYDFPHKSPQGWETASPEDRRRWEIYLCAAILCHTPLADTAQGQKQAREKLLSWFPRRCRGRPPRQSPQDPKLRELERLCRKLIDMLPTIKSRVGWWSRWHRDGIIRYRIGQAILWTYVRSELYAAHQEDACNGRVREELRLEDLRYEHLLGYAQEMINACPLVRHISPKKLVDGALNPGLQADLDTAKEFRIRAGSIRSVLSRSRPT